MAKYWMPKKGSPRTAHGLYHGEPELDIERLQKIRARVHIPLVLHGGTGLSAEQFRAAIAAGISKINVATNLFVTTGKRLVEAAKAADVSYFALSKVAITSFQERCGYYLDLFSATGKAERQTS
jgi:fructose-bisphosphate aldolase class II